MTDGINNVTKMLDLAVAEAGIYDTSSQEKAFKLGYATAILNILCIRYPDVAKDINDEILRLEKGMYDANN